MLAKLGITSPFNKRKVKESSQTSEMLPPPPGQQNKPTYQQQQATSIPTNVKKFSFGFQPNSKLPVVTSIARINCDSSSSSSGISNITSVSQINPNVISQCDSTSSSTSSMSNKSISNAALVSKSSHSYQSSSKLPSASFASNSMQQQSQISTLTVPTPPADSSSSNCDEKRKLGFGFNKTRAIPTVQAPQPPADNIMKSNKTVIQVGPMDQAIKQSDQPKSIKKPASTVSSQSNGAANQADMLSSTSNSNIVRRQSSTFGLPKLTKINTSLANQATIIPKQPASVESDSVDSTKTTVNTATPGESKLAAPSVNSKIPGSSFLTGLKSQLKSPSVQLNTTFKQTAQSESNNKPVTGNSSFKLASTSNTAQQNSSSPISSVTGSSVSKLKATVFNNPNVASSGPSVGVRKPSNISFTKSKPATTTNTNQAAIQQQSGTSSNIARPKQQANVSSCSSNDSNSSSQSQMSHSSFVYTTETRPVSSSKLVMAYTASTKYSSSSSNQKDRPHSKPVDDTNITNQESRPCSVFGSNQLVDGSEMSLVASVAKYVSANGENSLSTDDLTVENVNLVVDDTDDQLVANQVEASNEKKQDLADIESTKTQIDLELDILKQQGGNTVTNSSSSLSESLPSPPVLEPPLQNLLSPSNSDNLPSLPPTPPRSSSTSNRTNKEMPSSSSASNSPTLSTTSSESCHSNNNNNINAGGSFLPPLPSTHNYDNLEKIVPLNLHSFGRSNTLDRKLKPLVTTRTSSVDNNNDEVKLTTGKLVEPIQRNSLINLKTNLMFNGHKRPLSQDTIMEMNNESTANCLNIISNKLSQNSINYLNSTGNGTLTKYQQLSIELENAKSRLATVSNQLNQSTQYACTLEQTVSVLTYKLQSLALESQKKDNIIIELKNYVENLQSKYPKIFETEKSQLSRSVMAALTRYNSSDSINSLNSMFSQKSFQSNNLSVNMSQFSGNVEAMANGAADSSFSKNKKMSWIRSSLNRAFSRKHQNKLKSGMTADGGVASSGHETATKKYVCLSDVDENEYSSKTDNCGSLDQASNRASLNLKGGDFSLPTSPLHQVDLTKRNSFSIQNNGAENMEEFQRQLRDKEIKLTDLRLEAITTAHQLDQIKDENLKMRIEMDQIKTENARLQQFFSTLQAQQQTQQHQANSSIISSPSPVSSSISSASTPKMNLSLSIHNMDNILTSPSMSQNTTNSSSCSVASSKSPHLLSLPNTPTDLFTTETSGKRVPVSIYMGHATNPASDPQLADFQIYIGHLVVGTRTKWDLLDTQIRQHFKDYVNKLDQVTVESGGLGLSVDSIAFYYVGEMLRSGSSENAEQTTKLPDLLPYGYLVGNQTNILIKLKDDPSCLNLDSLSYDTLVPKNVMQRYIKLILEHKNLLFCGPSGTNKSYVARKIGEYLSRRGGSRHQMPDTSSLIYYDVENKSCKEVKQFLSSLLVDDHQSDSSVLILDNLHHISNLSDAFSDYFSSSSLKKCSYVIGTINQSNVTALNLHPNFKWILCVNHTEPVKNYLNRYLERRLIDYEAKLISSHQQTGGLLNSPEQHQQLMLIEQNLKDMKAVFEWIPKLWHHVNKYIETYNSLDLTIGPKLLITCPIDFRQAQEWFVELWNGTLVPTLLDVVREGIQVYDTKVGSWEDPKTWLQTTMPWIYYNPDLISSLASIEASQLGCEINNDEEEDEDRQEMTSNVVIRRRMNDDDFLILESSKIAQQNRAAQFMSCQNTPAKSLFGNRISGSRNSNDSDKLLSMLLKLQETTIRSSSHGTSLPQPDRFESMCQTAFESNL